MSLASADHDPFSRALGAIAVAITEAAVTGTWTRLKSCPGHLCGWAFYDRSAAARSRWCSMQLCGARAKMRTYRARYYPGPVSPPRAAGPARTADGRR
jgi:predicted RNA-binding Zn ribbon-like protein